MKINWIKVASRAEALGISDSEYLEIILRDLEDRGDDDDEE